MAKRKKPAVKTAWVPLGRSRQHVPGERVEFYDPNDPPPEAVQFIKDEAAARAKLLGRS